MHRFSGRTLLLGFCVVMFGAAWLTLGEDAWRGAGSDPQEKTAWEEEDESVREKRLSAALAAIQHRINAKHQIAAEVVAGRLNLPQAANAFRALNEMRTRMRRLPLPPDAGVEEVLCRDVINYVEYALRDQPGEADVVRKRLEAELQDHLAQRERCPIEFADQ